MQRQPPGTPVLDRRQVLGLLGTGALAAVLPGCTGTAEVGESPFRGASCVPRGDLDRHPSVGGLPLVYEVTQRRSAFSFETGFFSQLENWLATYTDLSPLAPPDQVWSYGGWTDGGTGCDSWHNAGRAFDLARLRLDDGTFVSCRYDLWRDAGAAELEQSRREYWALAASLHRDFAFVLTYLYNAQHANHIHVDNGRSGAGLSTLSTRSRAQVQSVQAICSYLWDEPVELTGRWDTATRRATRRVLDQIGVDDDLDASDEAWRSFLTSSAGRGGA